MLQKIYSFLKWCCAPKDVTYFTGFCLFIVSILLVAFMSAYFSRVIIDNRVLNENPMFKMVKEADAFMKDMYKNVSGNLLLNDYKWLNDFKMLIVSDCHIVPDSLKYLHYTGYLMAAYNIILMHVLLNDILPVSVLACIPIIISFVSSDIDSSKIILLGLFEFSQLLLSIVIMGTFIFLNERKIRPQSIFERDHEQ